MPMMNGFRVRVPLGRGGKSPTPTEGRPVGFGGTCKTGLLFSAVGARTVRVVVGDGGVVMASSDEVDTGAAAGDGLAVAIQPQTADALVITSSAEAPPQAPKTQFCAADCSAMALEHWQA